MNVILGHYLLDKNWNLELNEYIRWDESEKVEKSGAWKTAIGLQYVGGLKPSKYLIETAKDHIEGKVSISKADIISVRIEKLFGEKTFQWYICQKFIVFQKCISASKL